VRRPLAPPVPPPVPPLGETAVSRIERAVFAALDARAPAAAVARVPRRRLFALSLAGAVAAGVVFGAREWRRDDGPPSRAQVSTAQLSTTTSGSHIAVLGATLDVAPESNVSFGSARDGSVIVALDRGAVTCEVAPRSKRAPFVVEAGETRVTVIGTRFTVHRVGAHATVSVEHGLVEVADTNMTELVHAGERFRPGEPVTLEPLASEAPAAAVVGPASAPAAPVATAPAAHRPSGAALAAVGAVVAARDTARAWHARHLALDRGARAGARVDEARSDDARIDDARIDDARARARAAPEGPAASVAVAVPVAADRQPGLGARAGASRSSAQVLFELAAQLEVRDPEAALRIYGEIATGEDAWGASASFASARLEAEGGQDAAARAACEDYLRRFPRGPNADDARSLLTSLAPSR
jgi:hypothetical protein